MARILITDGESRTALACARALSADGHEVFVIGARPDMLTAASRHVRASAVVAMPVGDGTDFVCSVSALVARWSVDLVLPTTDTSMGGLIGHGTTLGGARLIAPPADAYEVLSDKGRLMDVASALGVPVPRTFKAANATELAHAASQVGFPCVLKPHRSILDTGAVLTQFFVSFADSPEALASVAQRYPAEAYPILVQERIVGPGEGAFFLMHHGTVVTAFAHRRLREYPPSGGASTYRESVPVPDDLRDYGARLLSSVGWHGAAMVEFKRCSATARPYLMEVNGRLWGSLKLAIDAGVNFPSLLAGQALGKPLATVPPFRTGIRCRWFWGDVNLLIDRLAHSRGELNLPADAPSRLRVALDFLAWHPLVDRFEVFDWTDPGPFLRESANWFRDRLGRAWRRLLAPSPTADRT